MILPPLVFPAIAINTTVRYACILDLCAIPFYHCRVLIQVCGVQYTFLLYHKTFYHGKVYHGCYSSIFYNCAIPFYHPK